MELFIALAVIIGLAELKEWKNNKRIDELNKKIENISLELDVIKKIAEQLREIKQDLEGIKSVENIKMDTLTEVKASVDTILREYDLNGTPLGYIRKPNHDFIEGL